MSIKLVLKQEPAHHTDEPRNILDLIDAVDLLDDDDLPEIIVLRRPRKPRLQHKLRVTIVEAR